MHAKSLIMAAALITFSAAPGFAQPAPDQAGAMPNPAPMPGGSGAQPDAPVAATMADLQPKAMVYDATGATVGTIESVTRTGGVVSTGTARAEIPIASFAKNAHGLVLGMSKTQLEAAVAKATPPKS